MSESEIIDLALRLWPQVRDSGRVDDPSDLDILLETQNQPGAIRRECGQQYTFACFAPDADAALTLPTGETAEGDDARFIGHLLVTRTLLGAGLSIDERVLGAMCDAYSYSWTISSGGNYRQSSLALATLLWLSALDPNSGSDRPLPIEWDADCFTSDDRWDPDYRLFSHYDMRERGLDWTMYLSANAERLSGVSVWSIVEPLLRMGQESSARLALAQFAEVSDSGSERAGAAAMLERSRVATMLREYLSAQSGG
jgi:hypothetical protein